MSLPYVLPWEVFPWDKFQQLTLLLTEQVFPGTLFNEYLKQGAPQYGVDHTSFIYEDGKFTAVQCKKEKKISEKDLEKIFTKFVTDKLAADCNVFILATIADLNFAPQKRTIDAWKIKMHDEYNIRLEVWDRTTIDKLLVTSWDLTSSYFGKNAADDYCIPEVFNTGFPDLQEVINYMPRKITAISNDEMRWFAPRNELLELKDIFLHNTLKPNLIGILGSPYFGKTTYLKQTAYLLHIDESKFLPLFLEVKNIVVQPIEQLLDARYGSWKKLPLRSMILLIDGLDEVPTDKFNEMVRHIHTFSEKYRNISIVISCRRLFFEKYWIGKTLDKFLFFELYRLEHEDVHGYLQKRLKSDYDSFMDLVRRHNLYNSLYHPFYIENLVNGFLEAGTLPKSKIEVVQNFIDKAFTLANQRQLTGGENLQDESVLFRKVIKRFALALQIAGVNALSADYIQQLFTKKERELLQHNSMVNANSDGWSFTNAMFQEHFAAFALTTSDIDTIMRLSAVGTRTKKIKTKWLQTLASLLSILNEDDPLFRQLLEYFRADNIELLFSAEPMKFQRDFRYQLLVESVDKVKMQQVRLVVASERTIGEFVDGIDDAINFLLDNVADDENSEVVKIACCNILLGMRLGRAYHERLRQVVLKETGSTSNAYYASHLIDLLQSEKAADAVTVDALVKIPAFTGNHEYRKGLYELIVETGLTDVYYDYALAGLVPLLSYNKRSTVAGSEYSLQELLLNTKSYPNIKKLFTLITHKEWLEKYRYGSPKGQDFLKRLLDKCADLFHTNPYIIFPVVDYMKKMGNHYLREAHSEFDDFFTKTGSEIIAIHLLFNDLLDDKMWQIGADITRPCFDYLMYQLEEQNATVRQVTHCLYGLRFRKEKDEYKELRDACDNMLGGELTRQDEKYEEHAYHKVEAIKRSNDKLYFTSRENFREGIINFFNLHGKKSIDTEELFIDPGEDLRRNQFDSNFLFSHIIDLKRAKSDKVTLSTCLKVTEKELEFDYFRVWMIMHHSSDPDPIYREIAQAYFDKYLAWEDLTNAYWQDDKGNTVRVPFRVMIGSLFTKFEFDATQDKLLDLLWLDHGGLLGWEHEINNRNKSVAQIVIEKLGNAGEQLVKGRVLANLQLGIKHTEVLGAHLSLVKRLKITDAKSYLWEHIEKNTFDQYRTFGLIEDYLALGGGLPEVIKYFSALTDYDNYTYWKLAEFLLDKKPEIVRTSTKSAIASGKVTEEYKMTTAMYLATLGEIESFEYITSNMGYSPDREHHAPGNTAVQNVDTAQAFQLIDPLMYMLIDPRFNDTGHSHNSARGGIVDLLYKFSAKSEADMILVLEFIYRHIEELNKVYGVASSVLHYYANKILEDFRASDKKEYNVGDIQRELSIIGM